MEVRETKTSLHISRSATILLVQIGSYKQQILKVKILEMLHNSSRRGHLGYDKKIQQLSREFNWPGLKVKVKKFINGCNMCQCVKPEDNLSIGLLQPLFTPLKPWANITMDFFGGVVHLTHTPIQSLFWPNSSLNMFSSFVDCKIPSSCTRISHY